ncbi:MAG: aminotransferase class V-fold PLP-dependent enzyme [Candidatus Eremiobacteraeota bacterium]|nr:aminotransferase class V-fold PLP-dependent enzyme [Candidatus Eremiobacteraeota bacterium]
MIYLDYAATAPLRPEIAERVHELGLQQLGNPSSLHRAGRKARMVMEHARERVAECLGAKVEEILFCSGATEADNLAILGAVSHADTRQQHLISSLVEHAAVYETVKRQEQLGRSVSWIRVNSTGMVEAEHSSELLEKNPSSVVSVMVANNEVGTRQPVFEVGELCRRHGALYHADGVQDPKTSRALIQAGLVDLVCLSGHKLGGLHGGVLYVRQGVALNPQIVGGSQEDGRRAGTSEVVRAESLAMALEISLAEQETSVDDCRAVLEEVLGQIEGAHRLSPDSERAPHISSWLFGNLAAEPILVALDMKGVCASSGSACSSHSVEPSRVVKAMGYEDRRASGLVRFSFGWKSDTKETERAATIVKDVVERLMQKEKERQ